MYQRYILFLLFGALSHFGLAQSVNDLLSAANKSFENGDNARAIIQYDQVIAIGSPDSLVQKAFLGKIDVLLAMGDYQNVIHTGKMALINPSVKDKNFVSAVSILSGISNGFINMGVMDSADFYAEKSRNLVVANISPALNTGNLVPLGEPFTQLAMLQYYQGNYSGAVDQLLAFFDLLDKHGIVNAEAKKRIHMLLGICYSGLGDLDKAVKSYQTARVIEESKASPDPDFLGTLYINISSVYGYMTDARSSLDALLKAIGLYLQVPELRNEMADLYSSAAFTYSEMGDLDSARFYLVKTWDYFNKYPTYLYNESIINSKVASTYLNLDDYENAVKYTQKGLEQKRKVYGENTTVAIYDYIRFHKIYRSTERYDLAEIYLDSAEMSNSSETGGTRDPYLAIEIETERMKLLQVIGISSDSLFSFIETQHTSITKKRRQLTGELSKTNAAADFYSSAVPICFGSSQKGKNDEWVQLALQMVESNKSLLLMDFILEGEKFSNVGIDQSYISAKDSLKGLASKFEAEIASMTDLDSLGNIVIAKTDSLAQIEEAYLVLMDQIKSDYPEFYNYKYANEVLNLNEVQSILASENRQILTYHISGKQLYSFLINAQEMHLISQPWDLEDKILEFRDAVTQLGDLETLNELSIAFYKSLIAPAEEYLNPSSRLTIIPDGVLNYLPFDVLKADESSPYLISEYIVSYDYSLQLFEHFRKTKSNNSSDLLAFAPEFNGNAIDDDPVRAGVAALPGAQEEVREIGEIFNSKLFVGNEATEEQFKSNASKYGVLHLATHALINDYSPSKSRLVFQLGDLNDEEDGYLNAYEIFNMRLHADLVTLSACNTAYGTIKKGEGVMSLSRAFAYAGCPNTLVSLWPSSDKSSPEIMRLFYENLSDGLPKDEALREAKLTYLETVKGKGGHPFYWSGFVFIGQPAPFANDFPILAIIVSALVILSIIYFFVQRRKDQT